jgi:hypothetical protein
VAEEEPKKPEILVNKDLMGDFDSSAFKRHGPPIRGVEQHDAGKPDDGRVAKAEQSHTLTDMLKDFEFFTTALICGMGRFDRDPVSEFNRVYPISDEAELPFAIDYAEPFFQGLGIGLCAGTPVNWDHRIYGIVRSRWELCRDTIAGIAIMDRKTSFYARVNFYEIQMTDLPAVKKHAVIDQIPTIPLTVFGVSSTQAFSYLAPADYPARPQLVNAPAKPDLQMEGASVIGPPPSPERLLPKES